MRQFGLIGFPLGHSFSKKYFSEKFQNENIDARYDLYELSNISEFPNLRNSIKLSGLNVTIPYKEQIIPLLDKLDDTAASIGAVNVIRFDYDNNGKATLTGFNTDAIGFENSLKPFLKPHHKKALILGTGGASKAILYTLQQLGIECSYVSRSTREGQLTYSDLNEEILNDNLLIVNATPLGTFPKTDACPDIPYQFLTDKHLLFDVVYNPAETLFMKKGRDAGATALNGEEMLIGQAIAAWEIWNR
ncbi:MAG: shikimate dehydrogenase [Paludibacter sp.]|jgi:shikimate dehydrogenase|nr:shikimate dehydrogenase [Paludibacter sp.]MDD3489428.1 shikimate dehydrogenase [Paludibacter sp.]